MKFSEFPYSRVDLAAFEQECEECIKKLLSAEDYATAKEACLEFEVLGARVNTQGSISYIRHTINTNDEFYSAENDFWDEAQPILSNSSVKFISAMLGSRFAEDFKKEFGEVLFLNAEISLKAFSPEIIPDMQEENALTSEYDKLIASAKIDFMGETRTVSQMAPFLTDADDAVRANAWKAVSEFYVSIGDRLDSLYDELVHKRDGMGKKLGNPDYVQLGYYRMMRNCYGKDDVAKFRSAVKKHIVPIATEIKRKQAERIGVPYPMTFADDALAFRSGNPRPALDSDGILDCGKRMYEDMSPETAEFIGKMFECEMFDVLSKPGKAAGGYCATLEDYKLPFIFANFNGTKHDVEVITHEAGHAFAAYMCRDIVPSSCAQPSLEACEVHSMSMEFFARPYAKEFFGDDADKFLYAHLADALTFIPYGTMVDEFQHIVYENPSLTPAERHEVWAKLESEYRPWLKLDGSPFYGCGKGWQRQPHIYLNPFYYIDYCLAQSVALRFWAMMQEDRDAAWKCYLEYVKKGGTLTFAGLLENAGIETPFGEDALKKIADAANAYLENFDVMRLK